MSVFRGKIAARMAEREVGWRGCWRKLWLSCLSVIVWVANGDNQNKPLASRNESQFRIQLHGTLGNKFLLPGPIQYHSPDLQLYYRLCSPVHLKLAVFDSNSDRLDPWLGRRGRPKKICPYQLQHVQLWVAVICPVLCGVWAFQIKHIWHSCIPKSVHPAFAGCAISSGVDSFGGLW